MSKKDILVVVSVFLFLVIMVTASTFIDNSQGDFDNGAYYQTFYNTSSFIQLNATNITRIF